MKAWNGLAGIGSSIVGGLANTVIPGSGALISSGEKGLTGFFNRKYNQQLQKWNGNDFKTWG